MGLLGLYGIIEMPIINKSTITRIYKERGDTPKYNAMSTTLFLPPVEIASPFLAPYEIAIGMQQALISGAV